MCGKNFQIYGVHIHRKCIDSRSCHHSLSRRKLLIPEAAFFRKSVLLQQQTRMKGNFDWLYQNLVRKHEDDLEHYVFLYFV